MFLWSDGTNLFILRWCMATKHSFTHTLSLTRTYTYTHSHKECEREPHTEHTHTNSEKRGNTFRRPSLFADFVSTNSLIHIGKNSPK